MAIVHEASIEGIIEEGSINFGESGNVLRLKALGVQIEFKEGEMSTPVPGSGVVPRPTSIESPTAALTVADVKNPAPLPGRGMLKGFESGTVIATGRYDTVSNVFLADFLEIEPAETVLAGALTHNGPGSGIGQRDVRINGTRIVMLTDARMPSDPQHPCCGPPDPMNPCSEMPSGQPLYKNQYEFPMRIESAVIADEDSTDPIPPTLAEGYYGNDGLFYAHTFVYGGTGEFAQDPVVTPQISIERADFRDDGESRVRYDFRGFIALRFDSPDPQLLVKRYDHVPGATDPDEGLLLGPVDELQQVELVDGQYKVLRWHFRQTVVKPAPPRNSAPLQLCVESQTDPHLWKGEEPVVRE